MKPDEPHPVHRPRLVDAAGDPLARPELGREPHPEPRPKLILPSDSPYAIERATLAEAIAAAALHFCSLDAPFHALNFALAIGEPNEPTSELLRQMAVLQSVMRPSGAETAMAAFDVLDVATRAWAPYAHPIGRAAGPFR